MHTSGSWFKRKTYSLRKIQICFNDNKKINLAKPLKNHWLGFYGGRNKTRFTRQAIAK